MAWLKNLRRRMFGGTPVYDGTGGGRRALAWMPGNPGAVAALSLAQDELRAKSRDLVRRNAWAAAGIEAFVANAIGTGINLTKLLGNDAVKSYITRHEPEILEHFELVVNTVSMEEAVQQQLEADGEFEEPFNQSEG